MLRYKTKTRPGLVALYDIRPGNGAGPFLQPRSPHGVILCRVDLNNVNMLLYLLQKYPGENFGSFDDKDRLGFNYAYSSRSRLFSYPEHSKRFAVEVSSHCSPL